MNQAKATADMEEKVPPKQIPKSFEYRSDEIGLTQ
jgi:hypothetical protein